MKKDVLHPKRNKDIQAMRGRPCLPNARTRGSGRRGRNNALMAMPSERSGFIAIRGLDMLEKNEGVKELGCSSDNK